jgi:hypothetical protein
MCKNDIFLQKSAAKVLIFNHTSKLIAQKQFICAHIGCFVQFIWMEIDNNQSEFIYFYKKVVPLQPQLTIWKRKNIIIRLPPGCRAG